MLVRIKYHDNESFNMEEVIAQAKRNYGKNIEVEVLPESNLPHDMLYFALQQMVVHTQLSLLYNSGANYTYDLKKLRAETLHKVEEILNEVIMDTEAKVK
jgi:hypothetical protein